MITKFKKIGNLKTIRGTWDGQTDKTYIEMNSKKVVYRRMFNFGTSKKTAVANKNSNNWIMHEYHLDGERVILMIT